MKILGKVLLGIITVIVIAGIFFFTSDMVNTADEFFVAIKNEDIDDAYTFLSEDFDDRSDIYC